MLTIYQRQEKLKFLGFYTGALDGIEGVLTRKAYKLLQDTYFTRAVDKDGIYGNDTERLLINAYNVKMYTKNFTLDEFKCECNGLCTGYPAILDIELLANVQKVRNKFGATTITSGLRCKRYNDSLAGSSATSRHMNGKALDIYNSKTRTKDGRTIVKNFVSSLPEHNYTYSDTVGMGNAVHFDVK